MSTSRKAGAVVFFILAAIFVVMAFMESRDYDRTTGWKTVNGTVQFVDHPPDHAQHATVTYGYQVDGE